MALSRKSIIGAYEAKTHFSELLERVEKGEEVTITRHGSPIARITPIRRKASREERADVINRWRERVRPSLGGLKVRDLIDEGRP